MSYIQRQRRAHAWFYTGLMVGLSLLFLGWLLHSGQTLTVPGGRLMAIGRLFGLVATFSILLEVLLMSRWPLIDKYFDLQEIVDLHRWTGFATIFGLAGHVVFLVMGYSSAGHVGWWQQFLNFNTQFEDVLNATLGTAVFAVVIGLSTKVLRSKLPHEVWYFLHLTLYGAILLTFGHQLNVGADFISQPWFSAYWYVLYGGVAAAVAWYRFLRPAINYFYHGFTIESVKAEAAGIYSVIIRGHDIARFQFEPGQYARWHILRRGLWYQAHPFSFSSPAGENQLRFTVKAPSGDFSQQIPNLRPGTKVLIDGPRGAFVAGRADLAKRVILVAGGIGVAPYMSIVQTLLDKGKSITILYAVRSASEIAFKDELTYLRQIGVNVQVYLSERGQRIDESVLEPMIDGETVVFLCGPDGMSRALDRGLRQAGLPSARIISERFAL